jgi:hypothetical protein
MIRRLFFITLASLALLVPAGNAAAFSDGQRHRCGVLVDAAHPWRSHVPGGNVETGDHWITDRLGTHGSCTFTHAAIKKLLALAPRTYRQRDAGHLDGGLLFLHGFPETAESFREILPTVARACY